jgi:purine catabolism regulator
MLPTLRGILDSAALQAGQPEVLSGADRLSRPVRWVHVTEVRDVSGLLSGGELVLSTGLPLVESGGEEYVTSLIAAGAAGLVLELGPTLPEVPTPALEVARAASFPLIALRRPVRYVDITEQVHRAIVAEQYDFVDFARSTHEVFTALSLEGADPARIVSATADLCGSSVVLEDLARHVLAHAARGRPTAGLLADWAERSRRTPARGEVGLSGAEGWITAPVGIGGAAWGRLVVPDPRMPQERLVMVLERAAQALEMGRMAERDRAVLALQAQGGLLGELAQRRIASEDEARSRMRAHGVRVGDLVVPVVAVRPRAGPVEEAGEDPVDAHGRTRGLAERVDAAAGRAGVPAIVGALRPGRVGVLVCPKPGLEESAALDRIAEQLAAEVILGVGRSSSQVVTAGASLPLAQQVAEVAAALPDRRRGWYHNRDLRLQGLVALLHDDPRVQTFAEAELGPLIEYDARHGTDHVAILRQYVACAGNMTRLAEISHRSRPALYKRLATVQRILGTDLSEPSSYLSVAFALLVHDESSAGGRRE